MELGTRELLTFATVLSGLAASWQLVKSQLANQAIQITKLAKKLASNDTRQDALEADRAVIQNQIKTIAGILAPTNLRNQSERDGAIEERLKSLEREVAAQRHLHNSKHPKIV